MAATGTVGLASPAAHAAPAPGSSGDGSERSRVIGTPTLTAEHKRDLARKDAEASEMWREAQELRSAVESGAEVTASGKNVAAALADCPDGDCSWQAVLAITQHTQINSYYCGPAMLQSLVEARSVSISQGAAASALGTTTAGTDWYQGGGVYPVEDALDAYLGSHGANYAPVGLAGSPSGSEKSDFKSRVYANTNNNWGIAGDAWQVPDGPHLIGHPEDELIFHWFAIRGYFDWGEETYYADPASGASSLTWGDDVPRYSTMDSDKVATIMGGRGYIW